MATCFPRRLSFGSPKSDRMPPIRASNRPRRCPKGGLGGSNRGSTGGGRTPIEAVVLPKRCHSEGLDYLAFIPENAETATVAGHLRKPGTRLELMTPSLP